MKIVTVLGARPQFVKAAVVSRAIANANGISEVIVHTGQHFDANMSEVFFEQMDIPKPDYFLDIHGGGHGQMTGAMLQKIEEVLLKEGPDWVLIYGDTNSTLAGALAASKLKINVAHVEAGLRSFNMRMPEEINRIVADRISSVLFCPTEIAVKNLETEGHNNLPTKIEISGDVMYDAALYYDHKIGGANDILQKLGVKPGEFVLATAHRAENTDDATRLKEIVTAMNTIHELTPVVLPLHPRTKNKLSEFGLELRVNLCEPLGYLEMIQLLRNCSLVMTDSGGLQKEAYFFQKYCLTMRDETEWVELINYKFNFLVGADKNKILEFWKKWNGKKLVSEIKLYGDGDAGEKIVNSLLNFTGGYF